MEIQAQTTFSTPRREPWNKGKLIGQKPPLRPKHVWAIRTRLQMDGRTRDLAMFNLAIDSKLRGCDVVALRVEDVAPSGYAVDRATVRQKKTGRPVTFELTEQTRQAGGLRRCGLDARDDLQADPDFAAVLADSNGAVDRLHCRAREERNLVGHLDLGGGGRHGLADIADILRNRP